MKTKVFLLLNLLCMSVLFKLIHAITTTPGQSSGNGNPAILFMLPIVLLFIVLLFQWFSVVDRWVTSLKRLGIVILVGVVHWIVALYYQRLSFLKYREVIVEAYVARFGEVDMNYIESITTGLSIHVNNQYFNVNTFFMLVSLSFVISAMIRVTVNRFRKIKKGAEFNQEHG